MPAPAPMPVHLRVAAQIRDPIVARRVPACDAPNFRGCASRTNGER
jgi:hypothetical protein